MWHVLEHVADLDATILKLKDKLHEDGTLIVAVPNHESDDGKYYRENWAGFDVPRHLWHFNRKSMNMLVEKNKMRIADVMPMKLDAFYISMLSEKYKKPDAGLNGLIRAAINGLRSNARAGDTGNYSSLIYIIKK